MSVGEQERHQLHSTLANVLGEREAATMMALTPPVGWGDVARRSDLDHLSVLTNTQLEQFRAEMVGRFEQSETAMSARFEQFETAMNARFEQSETAMNTRFEHFGSETAAKIEQLKTETTAHLEQMEERFERKLSESQNKLMIFVTTTTLTAVIAVAGVAFAASGLS